MPPNATHIQSQVPPFETLDPQKQSKHCCDSNSPLRVNNTEQIHPHTPVKVSKAPHYWLGDTHFAVSFRIEIDDVVAAVVVPTVHQHRVQDVVGRVLGVRLLEELIQR